MHQIKADCRWFTVNVNTCILYSAVVSSKDLMLLKDGMFYLLPKKLNSNRSDVRVKKNVKKKNI